jgi:hypothetical protein
LNKYFPVYAAILGVIALLLFLSPQIAKLISADTPAPIELLKNTDFAAEALNNQVWIRKTSDSANIIKVVSGVLRVENQNSDKAYTLISQKTELKENMLYRLKIDYDLPEKGLANASIGIQKNGYGSTYALIFPLEKGGVSNELYFLTDQSFKDPYFFLYLSSQGNILIKSVSLVAATDQSINPSQASSSNILSIEETTNPPSASLTPRSLTTPNPSPTPSPSVSPPLSLAAKAQTTTNTSQSIFYPGWSVVGFEKNSNADLFSKNNLDAYQILGGKWLRSNNSSAIFSSNAGAIVYSSNKDKKTFNLEPTESQASLVPALGWNLLYNSSDQEVSDNSTFYFSNGKTLPKEYKLEDLVKDKNASESVYLVSGDKNGVTLNKISFPEETIPAKTVFWFYLFKLP